MMINMKIRIPPSINSHSTDNGDNTIKSKQQKLEKVKTNRNLLAPPQSFHFCYFPFSTEMLTQNIKKETNT